MLYLKYRPQTIGQLDNSSVKDILSNLLKSKKLPHALLFTGKKGTGKTSAARIFAKSINCLNNAYAGKGESIEPCNTCTNCLSIDHSASTDVMEMDAASNRGIDEVRTLIREAAFSPMAGRYRVFIIDEAHMITNDAFNALLKTLEEPPEWVIFILATTNEEKIPKTILSRCQKIYFGEAKKQDIKNKLQKIVKQENTTLDEGVYDLIVKHSEKSFRDAIKLLEELLIQKKTSVLDAQQYLGVRSKEGLLDVMQNKSIKETLTWVNEFNTVGGNTKYLLETLLEELRLQLLLKSGVTTDEEVSNLQFSIVEISQLMKLLQEAYNNLRISPIESLPLEIALVEFYNIRSKK